MTTISKAEEVKEVADRLGAIPRRTPANSCASMVNLLHEHMLKYNWVGFYMIEKPLTAAEPPMLVLGAFEGAMTPHTPHSSKSGHLRSSGFQREDRDCRRR